MNILKVVALLGLLGAALSACNTVEGFGEDVQAGGRAVERSANDVQKKL